MSSRSFQVWRSTKPRSGSKEGLNTLVRPDTNAHTLGPSCPCRPLLHNSSHSSPEKLLPSLLVYTLHLHLGSDSPHLSQCQGQGVVWGETTLIDTTIYWTPILCEALSHNNTTLTSESKIFSTTQGSRSDSFFPHYKLHKPLKFTQLEGSRGKI